MTEFANRLCVSTYCINLVEKGRLHCPKCSKEGATNVAHKKEVKEPKEITLVGPLYLFAVFTDNVFQSYMAIACRENIPHDTSFVRYDYMGRINSVVED